MSDKPPSRLIDIPGEVDPDAPPDEPKPSLYVPGKATQTFELTSVKMVGHPSGRPSDVPLEDMTAQFKYCIVTDDLARTIQHRMHQWFSDALFHKPYRVWFQVVQGGGEINIEMQPTQYVHDCMSCTFLGRLNNEEDGRSYDLYACTSHSPDHRVTFIARYGSNGEEYTSGPEELVLATGNPVLKEAMNRWIRLRGELLVPQITQY